MQQKLKNRVGKAIEEGLFSACVIGIVTANGNRTILPGGSFEFEKKSITVTENTIFDVASITKAIPTSSLALKLIDENKLSLDDKLIKFIPEFRNSDRERVLVKHLLSHTLDYTFRLSAQKDKSPEEILDVIFATEFKSRPGTKFHYANATSILLGMVVEKIIGEPLDRLGEKYFFKPLEMNRTIYCPLEKFSQSEIVPTEIQAWRGGLVHGEVHDESAYALQQKMFAGSAGLFSTAPDLLNFLEMLLHSGTFKGIKYFSPEIIKQIQTNQLPHLGASTGLGWELNQPQYMGRHCDKKTFGKSGFTGCSIICDIRRNIAFTILSNYTFPTRKPDARAINKFRSDVADIIFESLLISKE
ncbi:MAG: serine hydrolase domain-containing protein [Candidatus Moraniibacteriota bacterium]